MKGRNHIVTGTAMAASAALALERFPVPAVIGAVLPLERYGYGPAGWAACAGCAALYVFGLALPDIDNHGLVSKWLHFSLPLRHRGWTHSLWAAALFLVPSLLVPACWPLRFVALGMLAHDLMDALSQAGWAMFYPFGRWRVYRDTVMARGWTPGLYSSSAPGSEDAVAGAVTVINIAWWAFWAYLRFFV